MSDRLAKQVAERLRAAEKLSIWTAHNGVVGSFATVPAEALPALAELVEAGSMASFEGDEGSGAKWDEALRRVSEALGITTNKEAR